MTVLQKNILFLTSFKQVKLIDLYNEYGVADSTISNWKAGKTPAKGPRKSTLKKLARFFTEKLNLPSELLKNGQILLEKDISDLVEQELQNPHIPPQRLPRDTTSVGGGILPSEQEPTAHEKQLIALLRELDRGSREYEVSPATLNTLIDFFKTCGLDPLFFERLVKMHNSMPQGISNAAHSNRSSINPSIKKNKE